MTRYKQRTDGEAFDVPTREITRWACCGCGLVHDLVFVAEVEGPIAVAARVNRRATAQRRRGMRRAVAPC